MGFRECSDAEEEAISAFLDALDGCDQLRRALANAVAHSFRHRHAARYRRTAQPGSVEVIGAFAAGENGADLGVAIDG